MQTTEYDIVTNDENKFKLIGKNWNNTVYWYQSDNMNYVEFHNAQIKVNTANTFITTTMNYYNSSFVPKYPTYYLEIFNSANYGQVLRFNNDGAIQVRSPVTGTRQFQGVLIYPREDKIVTD